MRRSGQDNKPHACMCNHMQRHAPLTTLVKPSGGGRYCVFVSVALGMPLLASPKLQPDCAWKLPAPRGRCVDGTPALDNCCCCCCWAWEPELGPGPASSFARSAKLLPVFFQTFGLPSGMVHGVLCSQGNAHSCCATCSVGLRERRIIASMRSSCAYVQRH